MNPEPLHIMIVIPVFNHAKTLKDVVIRSKEAHNSVMVVDDGSTDDGIKTLKGLDVHMVRHPVNLGKGMAIKTAAREAKRQGMTHIVTIDADGQHNPNDFMQFIPVMVQNPQAIIVGKRDFEKANVPRHSQIGRSISNFWFRVHTGQHIGDAQSGFRAYPLFIFDTLELHERRYSFEIEVLVKAAWTGIRLRDADISVYYPPGNERISHFRMITDNLRLSYLNFRLTLKSISHLKRKMNNL